MHYSWLLWSLLLVVIWIFFYVVLKTKEKRRQMLTVSLWTTLLGLTEPLFVPTYWTPSSLFDLAIRTGFDIESLIFSFAIGGIVIVLYNVIFRKTSIHMSTKAQHSNRHKYHIFALLSAPIVFVVLFFTSSLNPIYSVILALIIGGLSTLYCRPDLKKKMFISGLLFLGLYFFYFLTLITVYPGYVEAVWNLKNISGIIIFGIPVEELLFAFSFGFFWSSIYEHITWRSLRSQ